MKSLAVSTIFYRGLQDCPSGKALYVDYIKYKLDHNEVGDVSDELRKVLDILLEKEGRTRLPLEELDVLLEKEEDLSDDEDS